MYKVTAIVEKDTFYLDSDTSSEAGIYIIPEEMTQVGDTAIAVKPVEKPVIPDTKPVVKPQVVQKVQITETVETKVVDQTTGEIKVQKEIPKASLEALKEQITQTVKVADEVKQEAASKGIEVATPQISLSMSTATVIPAEALEAVKGKDVDLVLEMDGGYSWTINGTDVDAMNNINLEVKEDENVVPSDLVDEIAGDKPSKQLSLTHDGEFGFTAELTISLDSENAKEGDNGVLYYYDSNHKLVFREVSKVNADKTVTLGFNHASDYIVVVQHDVDKAEEGDTVTTDKELTDNQKVDFANKNVTVVEVKAGNVVQKVLYTKPGKLPESVAADVKVNVLMDNGTFWVFDSYNKDVADKMTAGFAVGEEITVVDNVFEKKYSGIKKVNVHFDYSSINSEKFAVRIPISVSGTFEDGKEVYLYYYNPSTGEFDLQNDGNSAIVSGGNVEFTFTHCSNYVVVDQILQEAVGQNPPDGDGDKEKPSTPVKSPDTGDKTPIAMNLIILLLGCVMVLGVSVLSYRKRRSR